MKAALNAGVRRIIVTSSVAAVRHTNIPDTNYVFTEKDFNTTATLKTSPYPYSKYLAEMKAWDMVKDKSLNKSGTDLITVNPAFVLGPPLSKRIDSTSVRTIK